jgi:gamma-glutamyl-gamma-aminobutyrate hydrolase PuuD
MARRAPLVAAPAYLVAPGRVEHWIDAGVAMPSLYVRAVRRAGGEAAVLMPDELASGDADALLGRFDGLLLIGGPDLDPATYGQEAVGSVYGVVRVRDDFELALARAAMERSMPILAICRGHQVLNVALGGDLDQHITDRFPGHGTPGVEDGARVHEIEVAPGSRLAACTGAARVRASCHHHQVLDRLAPGMRVVARAPDGVVEAVELDGAPQVISVQWHPEDTAATDPAQQAIFDAFVARCSE